MIKKNSLIVFFLLIISLSFCWPVSAEVVDKIIAIVNNDIVTLVQLNKETSSYKKNIEAASYSDEDKQKMVEKINIQILNNLIEQSLTHQEAKKYRITVSENAIDNAIKNTMESRSLTHEDLEKALKREGVTLKEYRENLKKQILRSKLINHAVKSKVIIMEADIEKYYENHIEEYSGQKKYYLRNILMNDKDKIQEVSKEIDGKTSFINLAQNNSTAPNAKDGGDLGLFDIKNLPENIKEKISKLQKDQFTGVISTPQGFQIFYIEDIIFEGGKTYDWAHDEINKILYDKQAEKQFKTWLESLKNKAHIKIML
jgi:peptidyl-prolyl cis-trans isomerase SurA